MIKYIFIGSFLFSALIFGVRLERLGITDLEIWTNQAYFVESHDPAQFDIKLAYAHPGGPVVEGTIAAHTLFSVSYRRALDIFLIVVFGLIVGGIAVVCYLLMQGSLWWLGSVGILSFEPLLYEATPTSAIASLLFVLLCLLTLYIWQRGATTRRLAWWALVLGLIISTRIDIGIVSSVLVFLLWWRVGIQKTLWSVLGAAGVFFITDPYMWFMPAAHVHDLIHELIYHYALYPELVPLSLTQLMLASSLGLVAIALALLTLLLRPHHPPLQPLFAASLIATTAALSYLYLNAHYQALRYFHPLIFLWEVLLLMYLFSYLAHMPREYFSGMLFTKKRRMFIEAGIIALLVSSSAFQVLLQIQLNHPFF